MRKQQARAEQKSSVILRMQNICKDYHTGGEVQHILKNIDLTVRTLRLRQVHADEHHRVPGCPHLRQL